MGDFDVHIRDFDVHVGYLWRHLVIKETMICRQKFAFLMFKYIENGGCTEKKEYEEINILQ